MPTDRKKLYIISSSILAALLVTLFAPLGFGRIIAAILLVPAATVSVLFLKKRPIRSINTKQVLMIISVIGLMYFIFYYVSATYFGFIKTGYGLYADIIFTLTLPIAVIIVATEVIRYVLCAPKDKIATALAYFIGLVTDVIICANFSAITNFATFMDVLGLAVFPGMLYNLLFNYLTVRYGFLPIIIYKGFTVWVYYLIPYGSAISDSLVAFINILLPIAIYLFIDSLYEKKRRYALGNTSRVGRFVSRVLTVIVVIIMLGTVMLVSNQFKYGSYVIATESMTGEINKGDVVIYQRYDDQIILEGQVIAFEKGKSVIIHRVVDIQIINGITRYYTKGDANEDMDYGYVTSSEIIGLVNHKVPYIGYPTIWARSLFKR